MRSRPALGVDPDTDLAGRTVPETGAVEPGPAGAPGRRPGFGPGGVLSSTAAVALAVYVVVAAAYLVALVANPPVTTGDEPHYLLIARSIVEDGDVDMANNYANPADVRAVYPDAGPLLSPNHAAVYRPGGPEVPVHALGLPVLVAGLLELGLGTTGVRVALALLAATIAPMLVVILNRLLPGHRVAVTVAATVTVLVAPLVLFSGLVYPDLPGAVLLTVAVVAVTARRPRVLSSLVASTALACVPWFQVRMTLLVLPLAAALLLRAWRAMGHRGDRPAGRVAPGVVLLAAVVVPLVASAVGLTVVNRMLYGSFSPTAAYAVAPLNTISFAVANLRVWATGVAFSPGAGVLPLAPVLLIAIVGIPLVVRRWRWPAVGVLAVVVVYYVLSTGAALGGGYCPPGRWVVAFAPAAAVPIAVVLARTVPARLVTGALAVLSLVGTVSAVGTSNLLVAGGTLSGRAAVPFVLAARGIWPPLGGAVGFDTLSQRASDLLHTVGVVAADGTVSTAAGDRAGAVAFGPGSDLPPGLYTATFTFPSVSGAAGADVAVAQVVDDRGLVGSADVVVGTGGAGPVTVSVPVSTSGREVQLRVFSTGVGAVQLADLELAPTAPGSVGAQPGVSRRALLALWLGILGLLLLVVLQPPRRRPPLQGVGSVPATTALTDSEQGGSATGRS